MQTLLSLEHAQSFVLSQHTAQGGPCVTQQCPGHPLLLPLLVSRGSPVKRQSSPFLRCSLSMGDTYGVTHKTDTQQIK